MIELGVIEAARLEPWSEAGIPNTVAAIGHGERADGSELLVAFSPRSASEATLAGLSAAQQRAEDSGFGGQLEIVAPQWPAGARRLLGLVGRTAYSVEPVAATALADGEGVVIEPDPEPRLLALRPSQLAARLASGEVRSAFDRAALALEGLAAKHGGSMRVGIDRLELVVMARRVAEIRIQGDDALLEVQIGGRSTTPLAGADLAGALDGLEGQLRRRLNDRRVREGEDGLRSRVVAQLALGTELRGLRAWPQPGVELDVVDGVGVDAEGNPVVVAAREELEWTALAAVLESLAPLGALLPILFAEMTAPLRLGSPRLLLAAERFATGLERALSALVVPYELRDVSALAGTGVGLVSRASGEGAEARGSRRGRRRGPRGGGRGGAGDGERAEGREKPEREAAAAESEGSGELEEVKAESVSRADEGGDAEEGGRRRGRRRRRPRGPRAPAGERQEPEAAPRDREGGEGQESRGGEGSRRGRARFEEVSLLDLDDGPGAGDESGSLDESESASGGRRRRPRRRGRRGGGGNGSERAAKDSASQDDSEASSEGRVDEDDLVDSDDLEEILSRLAGDVPEFEASESEDLSYEDDEEVEEDEDLRRRHDREKQRRARKGVDEEEAESERPSLRRRSAILVHADRDSLFAAMLLARDIRQLDGLWIYPQGELMTFFRSVATDLRDDTPIFVVGFQPSPARDVVQAASLYRGRLTWFDRHAWPPEDLMAMRESLGRDSIHGGEGIDSSLPLVLETCSRRSRFSDKLVDLATGRFTQHDFERWGRLWWSRFGEIVGKTGDIRADVASLLAGRPSDLAKEAALVAVPPPPAEVAYVAEHDFRLVHFGGHVMVVVPVEGDRDVHLVARVARERYDATLSLAYRVGEETLCFCGDEISGKRALDYLAMAEHLVNKLEWVEARPDADHVSRFRVRDLVTRPERLEEVVGEIAMGRTLLER
ncbi:MAG: hypothetical protein JRF61_22500 [Deltaproteobacteria bacterium]|jgi:hypothetical protein|nr:hypothetical protein [Deltaproteobacteria bacterium]